MRMGFFIWTIESINFLGRFLGFSILRRVNSDATFNSDKQIVARWDKQCGNVLPEDRFRKSAQCEIQRDSYGSERKDELPNSPAHRHDRCWQSTSIGRTRRHFSTEFDFYRVKQQYSSAETTQTQIWSICISSSSHMHNLKMGNAIVINHRTTSKL